MKALITILFLFTLLIARTQDTVVADSCEIISKEISLDTKKTVLESGNNKIYVNINGEGKSWWSDWLPFFATIIVAYVAYRGVIKQSKASSVSGFRVNWIEDLRVSYSKFLIALKNVDNKIRKRELDLKKYSKDEDLEQLQFLKTKIKLLINHGESEHIAFWEALTQYMQQHNEYYQGEYSEEKEQELDNKRIQMEQLLLAIFKKEWEKAKKFG